MGSVHAQAQEANLVSRDGQTSEQAVEHQAEPYFGKTAAIKAAIKATLNNKHRLFNLVEKYGGKRARNALEQRFNRYVEPELKELLKWDTLVWETVEHTVARSLIGTGIKDSTARSIGFWVSKVMSWFF